jgi:peptidoglycan/xylan/chitin deacetylase (PgdA/CDA1 family)
MPLFVLTYHAIDDAPGPTSVTPSLFADHIAGLAERGFVFVRLSEGLRRFAAGEPSRLVAVTFDDGYGSVAESAAPLLVARGAPATVFAIGGYVGRDNGWPSQPPGVRTARLMGWDELRALARVGWEIGAHGETHADLTRLGGSELERELASGPRLADRLGVEVRTLAYPYGRADAPVRAAAAAAGFESAVTTELRAVSRRFDPFAVPRIDAWYLRPAARAAALGTVSSAAFLAVRRAGRAVRSALEAAGRTLGGGGGSA